MLPTILTAVTKGASPSPDPLILPPTVNSEQAILDAVSETLQLRSLLTVARIQYSLWKVLEETTGQFTGMTV